MTPRKPPHKSPRKTAPARSAAPGASKARRTTTGAAKKPVRSPARRTTTVTPDDVEAQLEAIERGDGEGELDLGRGVGLHVSSLDKVYFPEAGVTKGGLMRYYAHVSPYLLPEIDGRPLVLKRYPDGVGGQMFFQQDAGAHVPDVVRVKPLPTEEKGVRARIIGGDLATLLYTVQLGAIEVHPWLSRVSDITSADRCLIDLDPGDDVPFSAVAELARDVRRIVEQSGLRAAVKTSGSSGIHLVLALPPKTSYDTSARLAMLVAEAVVALRPERATIERSVKARPAGSIYVDAMQNARGKSMASVYSVRARATATVSAPLEERELTGRLSTTAFNVRTMPGRIARKGDIWTGALGRGPSTRTLARALEALEKTLAAE
jgi:bifunctional non-homologous end joining protein LigD